MKIAPSRILCAVFALGFLIITPPPAISIAQESASDAAQVDRLAREVERVESVRAAKQLQIVYAQYSQFGLWHEMGSLFADNAELTWGKDEVRGPKAIERYFLATFGKGQAGLPPGGLHTEMIVRPVINLEPDGMTAKERWSELSMSGRYGGDADWAGGIYENDYVKERGIWKIAHLHYYPMFAGPYETGWRDTDPDMKIVPYHFTADEAGTPVPALPSYAYLPTNDSPRQIAKRLQDLEHRIDAMVDEDKILNLQNAYGHYIDRKMWDDVTDLFTQDGVLEISNVGIYDGVKSIRRALELSGPAGLKHGELNDHPMFDTVVTIAPSGIEARTRGLEMIQLGDTATGTASLGLSVFENRFVKGADGKWRIREMREFPVMKTDYYQGWAKSAIVDPPPVPEFAPDRAVPAADTPKQAMAVPDFFYPNPVTGKNVSYPRGMQLVGKGSIAPPFAAGQNTEPDSKSIADRVSDAKRRLAIAAAYQGVENILSAFGTWNDDMQWNKFSALFAEKGWRGKTSVGSYIGPERILKAETISRGLPTSPRTSSELHFRIQPVIDVAPDGQSAKLRTRYVHLRTSLNAAGTFASGMYPNDAAILEKGVWKFMNAAIDDSYLESRSYKDGWARATDPSPATVSAGLALQGSTAKLVSTFPPDVSITAMPFRQQGFLPGAIVRWPAIKPLFFAYPNPVSGRLPPLYCPDEHTCDPAMANVQYMK